MREERGRREGDPLTDSSSCDMSSIPFLMSVKYVSI